MASQQVISLQDCSADVAGRVGGKAIGLGALLREGLPVPAGFAVTTDAYRSCLRAAGLTNQISSLITDDTSPAELRRASAAIRELFTDDLLAAEVAAQIEAAYAQLGDDVPVAVRSSATAEDTAEASFAGQQDTYLWIQGTDAVKRHVVRCWASLFTAQAIGYRARFGIAPEDLAMGVVVQRMIPAHVAGVMMTIDPVTGDNDTIYVSAAYGLGEGVVKGDVGSDSYWIHKATLTPQRQELATKEQAHVYSPRAGEVVLQDVPRADQDKPALTEEQLIALADIGRRVEVAFRCAQDLEWAIAEGTIHLLQSRPETVWSQRHAQPSEAEPLNTLHTATRASATWSTTNVGESVPGVPSPLGWSIWRPAGELAVRRTFHMIGALSAGEATLPSAEEDWLLGIFYGHAAIRVDLLCEWVERVPGTDPMAMAEQTFSAIPEGYTSRAQYRYYPRVLTRSLVPFIHGRRLILEDHARMAATHAQAIPAIPQASEAASRKWLHLGITAWSESLYRQTLVTMGTVQPVADRLITLADRVGVSGQELMAGYGGHEETRAVNDAWACSRDRLDLATFIQRHGYHGWRSGELSSKVWREDHAPVHKLIDSYRAKSEDADPQIAEQQRMQRRRELEAAFLAALPLTRRPQGRLVLALAARYVPLRGVGKVSFLRGVDIARAASRRLGALLAQDGQLDHPEDVFYLTRDELLGTWPTNAKQLVATRRERRSRYNQLAIPQSFAGVPATETPVIDPNAETISGTAAGPGVVEGLARVVTNPEDAHVEEGEILVAHDTDPGWASLMFLSAGLIADIGGIMSHTAVVARELAIPCVVNTKHASRTINTGDRIRLDGNSGHIQILQRSR